MEAGYLYGTEIRFEGWGVSQAGEELTGAALVWSSDYDGEFGTGERVTTSVLSAGPQRITLTATDAFGLSASAEIEFMIFPAEGPDTVVIAPQGHNFQQVGETFQFQARAYRSTGHEIFNAPIRWLSQYPEIVEIDADGRATAHGEGTTQIAALINTGLDVIEVTVGRGEPIEEISWVVINPSQYIIDELGGTTTLTATAYGPGENAIPGVTFTWSSMDPSIATVDQNGVVTARGFGTVRIRAEAGSVSGEAGIYVLEVGPPIAWDTIAAGEYHTCGLSNGAAYCWGDNEYGALGTGDTEPRMIPTRVVGAPIFKAISVGERYTVAITNTGMAYGWGRNSDGQLGDDSMIDRHLPEPVSSEVTFNAISAGRRHTAAIAATGEVYTWGNNSLGQLGNDQMQRSNLVPGPISGSYAMGVTFSEIGAGDDFTVALDEDGAAYSWGWNRYSQLGWGATGPGNYSDLPMPVVGGHTFTMLSVGTNHTMALTADGDAYGWGNGGSGSIGNGGTGWYSVPQKVAIDQGLVWISAGGISSMGITRSGEVYGWGWNFYGQLGDGSTLGGNLPRLVIDSSFGFTALITAAEHTVGLRADGIAYIWGRNAGGRLGDGTITDQHSPVPLVGPAP
jgi:alpha-tubulin suppressor-like RCC1 family protein